jgi:anaerobic selenocysteine-containing dehydrogenase
MGLGSERHDVHSYETHAGQWLGFRQPVLRAARERLGETITDTRQVNPGEVWEENEFWIALSWRIDPDGSLGIRRYFESPSRPGQKVSVDEYYGWMFEHSVPGLPEAAAQDGLTPLQYMRRYGSFEIARAVYQPYERILSSEELAGTEVDPETGIIWRLPQDTEAAAAPHRAASSGDGLSARPATRPNMVPKPAPPPRADGATRVGILIDGVPRAGWPTPSGKLELYSTTLRDWGWPEYALPGYIRSHVHPDLLDRGKNEFCLVPTFRLPVLIHTRSGNAKWLNEIAQSNPLWMHPVDAARLGVKTGDLVRVSTEIGYFVPYVWVTEGLRPGVVACSHHMGRWRLQQGAGGDRWSTGVVDLERMAPGRWRMRLKEGVHGFASDDPDSARVWWTDAGVHQNLTFPVHPDPVSGAHSWHQKVRVERAHPEDRYADVSVDTARAHAIYKEWLARARPAPGPGGLRRPLWLLRPYRPDPSAYKVPDTVEPERR